MHVLSAQAQGARGGLGWAAKAPVWRERELLVLVRVLVLFWCSFRALFWD